jgi:hypothetical protein
MLVKLLQIDRQCPRGLCQRQVSFEYGDPNLAHAALCDWAYPAMSIEN